MGETKATATELGRDTAEKVRASVATNELAQRAREAAYTLVGLGVMGAQRATQAAKQLRESDTTVAVDVDSLRTKTKDATDVAKRQFTKVDEVLAGAIARIEDAMAPIEERLPAAAKDTVQKVRVTGKGLHAQLRSKVAATTPEGSESEPATDELGAPKTRTRKSQAA